MTAPHPGLVVLIGLYNGAEHLREQLESLRAQTVLPARIIGSDDGSTDATRAVFTGFAADWPDTRMDLVDGPREGLSRNFLSMIGRLDPDTRYAALCDQDDVWLPEKLGWALAWLAPHDDVPALYGARSWETAPDLSGRTLSRAVPGRLDFAHALVQNYAGGNTMVLNRRAIELVQRALPVTGDVVVHDWWLYQLVAGAGGRIMFDTRPVLLYRQHGSNQIGAASGFGAKIARGRAMLGGSYRDWNRRNIAALDAVSDLLTPEARAKLADFGRHRQRGLVARITMARRTGINRKGWLNRLGLWVAILTGRI